MRSMLLRMVVVGAFCIITIAARDDAAAVVPEADFIEQHAQSEPEDTLSIAVQVFEALEDVWDHGHPLSPSERAVKDHLLLPGGKGLGHTTLVEAKAKTKTKTKAKSLPVDTIRSSGALMRHSYLTQTHIDAFKSVFDALDANKDNTVELAELSAVLKEMGKTQEELTAVALDNMMQEIDALAVGGSQGKIDFPEFLQLMKMKLAHYNSPEEIKQVFAIFDRDHNSMVSSQEVSATLDTLGLQLSALMLGDTISEADIDGDGMLDEEEFSGMLDAHDHN